MHPPAACLEQSLHSSTLELKYAHSTHLVDIIAKDEEIRRLRLDIHILEDDNDELRELLQHEEDRCDQFEKLVNQNVARAEDAEERLRDAETDLQSRENEVLALQAEKEALQHTSQDATAALTEKLALTRELSILKPELEHLKTQAASTEALMGEKLALQRQIMDIQCELENTKREHQRALAKRRSTGVEIAQEEQVEDLKRQLAKEKRARQRAELAVDNSQGDTQSDDTRKQLAKERKARQKAEEQLEAAREATQVEDVRKDLLKEKKTKAKLEESLENLRSELERERKSAARAAKRAEGNAEADEQAEELRQELVKEKKESAKAQKAAKQAADEFEAQKSTLDDKLNQFRASLRAARDKLKETEAELIAARQAPAPVPAKKTKAAPKANAKKRNVAQMDPDATTLGTPGDGPAAKRGRKAAPAMGDKSTFSITPFLNKTVSVVLEEEEEEEGAGSPAATKQSKRPLAEQPSKANVPPKKAERAKKAKPAPMLELITEEDENFPPKEKEQPQKVKTKTADGPEKPGDPTKKKSKIRKSLADFQSFNPEPEVEKKKKRKLGGLGKTLFDEEEESAPTGKSGFVSRGLFGSKAFGGGLKKSALGSSVLGGRSKVGSSILLTAGDGSGFQFSPLKKQRKGLDVTLRLG